tara:strand:+ start:457 stop:561 length:105 start_codon:yes stop_codon:yes gene_type:complete
MQPAGGKSARGPVVFSARSRAQPQAASNKLEKNI